MERYPIPPNASLTLHRRGSTPTLMQFATINAQLKKERTSPSLEVIDNADTDEDDPRDTSERLKSMGGEKSRSQPALNILHITSIKGRGNLLSLACASEYASSHIAAESEPSPCPVTNTLPPRPIAVAKRKNEKMEKSEPASQYLKRSSSHGCVLVQTSAGTSKPVETPVADRISNRRNTWCHASGTSAVAIDNKIEQAMDLVKSHLMFAVREEVEVLKEKIAELMERINQLEMENSILRAHATQETLAQLAAPPSPPTGPAS